jgi:hypothetical protein
VGVSLMTIYNVIIGIEYEIKIFTSLSAIRETKAKML